MVDVATKHTPSIVGLHHARIPVTDVLRSHDWYVNVFGFEPCLMLEEEDVVTGVVLQHDTGLTVVLVEAPAQAAALRGFCAVAFCVGERGDLTRWCARLDEMGIAHSDERDGHFGWFVQVPDVDGIVLELHTFGFPTAEEA
jgi:catechol 2,3-dioxygenase-like lactoylglutathione lyase family enzyme